MCLKGLVTFGSYEPFYFGKWACPVGAIPTYRVYRLSDKVADLEFDGIGRRYDDFVHQRSCTIQYRMILIKVVA